MSVQTPTAPAPIATKPKATAPPPFKQPPVDISDPVLYYDDYDSPVPRLAFVTSANEDSINCNVVTDGVNNFLCRNGVRHMTDPNRELVARVIAEGDGGVWETKTERKERLAAKKG